MTNISQKILNDLGVKRQDFVNVIQNNEGLQKDANQSDQQDKKKKGIGLSKFYVLKNNVEKQSAISGTAANLNNVV